MKKDSSIDESEWFQTVEDSIRNTPKGKTLYIIPCDRVSSEEDSINGTLERRSVIIRDKMQKIADKCNVPIEFTDEDCLFYESGRTKDLKCRKGLKKAKRTARKLMDEEKEVLIVFSSVNRAIRPDDFDLIKNKDAPLKESDMAEFQKIMNGVPYAVLIPPGTSEQEQENTLSRWGKRNPRKKQGRRPKIDNAPGCKKRMREELLSVVEKLVQQGYKNCEIRMILNLKYRLTLQKHGKNEIPKSTLEDWVTKIRKTG